MFLRSNIESSIADDIPIVDSIELMELRNISYEIVEAGHFINFALLRMSKMLAMLVEKSGTEDSRQLTVIKTVLYGKLPAEPNNGAISEQMANESILELINTGRKIIDVPDAVLMQKALTLRFMPTITNINIAVGKDMDAPINTQKYLKDKIAHLFCALIKENMT